MILMCAVCFRGGEPLMRDSLNAGIFVLLGVTLTVLACVAVFFVQLARRADALGERVPGPPVHGRGGVVIPPGAVLEPPLRTRPSPAFAASGQE